jgi:putative DNA primase/helicase
MQYIKEDGTKRFAKNSRKEGCFHALGGLNALAEAPALVIAEGFATAASISQELGFATISAFDSGNLEPVARALQEQFPDKPIIIMGDDDKHLEQTQNANPGKTKALEAANAVQGVALFPVFAPGEQEINPKSFSDFNDLAIKSVLGREGLHRQVNSLVDSIVLKHHLNNKDGIKLSSIEGQKRGLSI